MGERGYKYIEALRRGPSGPGLWRFTQNLPNSGQDSHAGEDGSRENGVQSWTAVRELANLVGFTNSVYDMEGPAAQAMAAVAEPEQTTDKNDRKEVAQMKTTKTNKKMLRRMGKQLAAGALALSILCPFLPNPSYALAGERLTQVITNVDNAGNPDGTGEFPTLTVEVNGVVDQANKLTGFVEVAIRYQPAVLHFDTNGELIADKDDPNYDHSEIQPFDDVAFALEYSSKLTPWEWEKTNGDGMKLDLLNPANAAVAVDMTGTLGEEFHPWNEKTSKGMKEIDVLHKKTRIAEGSVSLKSDAEGNNDGVDGNDGGYLYLMAGGFASKKFDVRDGSGNEVPEDTVVAVARFKYELDPTNEDNNPWSTMFKKGQDNPNVTDWIDPSKDACLVKIAPVDKVKTTKATVIDQEVIWNSGRSEARPNGNGGYYSTDTSDGREAYDPSLPTTDPNYVSTTSNCMAVALVDTTATTLSTTTVVPGKINYTLVNKLSYNFTGGDPDDYATILFYDWDDTLIGTLVVDRDLDSQERVNTYVKENLIYTDGNNVSAGDDTNLSLQDNTAAAISSLERMENYRGKYDYTGPGPDVTSPVVSDGDRYPLTNKLDYVFFKRPMVNDEATKPDETDTTKYPGGAADPDYIRDLEAWRATCYIQAEEPDPADITGATLRPKWDEELPYIHGWALVEDPAHPEEVWTTLGAVGELEDYTDYTDIGSSGSNNGQPARLTVKDGTLTFADFDFSAHPITADCMAVKAVYEPGVDLMPGGYYRLYKEPYYNKLSFANSENGGAFSVEVTYERANLRDGAIRGVKRFREPYVRQDTTVDMKWEVVAEKGVNHDLESSPNSEAYGARTKTTYTKVDVTNTEEIAFTMALSGRQNKLNYYLIEGRGYNFVAGVTRIDSDDTRSFPQATVDNYNYLVESSNPTDASDTTDPYWDVDEYDKRSGSHGFVLYGTLNAFMTKASQLRRGEIQESDFNQYVSTDAFGDANLKRADGSGPSLATLSAFRTAVKAAEKVAYDAHVLGDNSWWNLDQKCAQVSYHELQWFIIDYMGSSTPSTVTFRDDSGTGPMLSATIAWCHLDTSCADALSGKPNTWEKLMKAGHEGADADLELLTEAEVESYFHLRKDGSGTPYGKSDLPGFVTDIKAAVAAIEPLVGNDYTKITWDQVQYYLIHKAVMSTAADMDTEGARSYWWYDGATTGAASSWTELGTAAKDASSQNLSTTTLPDGQTVNGRHAKLNQLEDAFNANAAAGTDGTDPTWVSVTHNLASADANAVSASSGIKFSSFADFKTAVIGGWEAANDPGLATPVPNPSWEQIQYHVIHKDDPGYSFPVTDGDTQPESDTYFWKDGNQKIVDLKGLLNAAKNNTASWQNLTQSVIDQFKFRSGFDGTAFSSVNDFKTKLSSYVSAASAASLSAPDWNEVQYYLNFGTIPNNTIKNNAAPYFWWNIGDGNPQKVDFTTSGGGLASDADEIAAAIMDAAYRAQYNGNTAAWDDLTDAVLKTGRLAAAISGTETDFNSDFTLFGSGDLGTLKSIAVSLLQNKCAATGYPLPNSFYPSVPTASWEELQYAILNSGAYDPTITGNNSYWWKSADTAGNAPSVDLATAGTMIQAVATNPTDATALADLQAWFTDDVAANMKIDDGMGGDLASAGIDLATFPWDCLDYSGTTWPLTWAQLEAIFVYITFDFYDPYVDNIPVLSDTDAAAYLSGYGVPDQSQDPSWTSFTGFSLAPNRVALKKAPAKGNQPVTTTETSADGLTETTKTVTKTYNEETGFTDTTTVVTAVTRTQNEGVTVVTTTVTTTVVTMDPETGEALVETSSETSTTVEKEETEEPSTYTQDLDTVIVLPEETETPAGTDQPTDNDDNGAPVEADPSLDGERKEPEVSEPSDASQSGGEGYEGAPDDVGTGVPAGPTDTDTTPTGGASPSPTEDQEPANDPDEPDKTETPAGTDQPTTDGNNGAPIEADPDDGTEEGDAVGRDAPGTPTDTDTPTGMEKLLEILEQDGLVSETEENTLAAESGPLGSAAPTEKTGTTATNTIAEDPGGAEEVPRTVSSTLGPVPRQRAASSKGQVKIITRLQGMGRDGPLPLYTIRERILHFAGLWANGRK